MTSGAKGNLFVALAIGGIAAAMSMGIEHLVTSPIVFTLMPGLIGSMALSGNVHAFPLWISACFNFLFYFPAILALGAIIRLVRRRRLSRIEGSTSDNLD